MGAGHAHALYVHEHSPVHRLPPHVKIVSAVAFVVAVAVTPREALWAFGIDAIALLTVRGVARIPMRFVLARLAVILPFVAFAFVLPFVGEGEKTDVLGISVSEEGLWAMWNILAKATLGAATSILLAATTEVPRLLKGFERLRVPRLLTAIASFMLRYLEVITGELRRMRVAMAARGYSPRWIWQAKPIATSAGALFIRSYERGERIHAAMLARGFTGVMPDLYADTATRRQWLTATALPLLGATLAILGWVLR
ncbi:MAG TPA: cobalt ECF transporter T component CbiQ [Acidimicrobiia bacterium]|nr:cobalt ECF transporter T component CbiQ [Acidimicrobiia bacterium]